MTWCMPKYDTLNKTNSFSSNKFVGKKLELVPGYTTIMKCESESYNYNYY